MSANVRAKSHLCEIMLTIPGFSQLFLTGKPSIFITLVMSRWRNSCWILNSELMLAGLSLSLDTGSVIWTALRFWWNQSRLMLGFGRTNQIMQIRITFKGTTGPEAWRQGIIRIFLVGSQTSHDFTFLFFPHPGVLLSYVAAGLGDSLSSEMASS